MIYKKQTWKILILIIALIIVAGSLWFSNKIVNNIKADEKLRIKIWSDAVKNTVNQLYVTGKLFDKLRDEERQKVKIWAKAMQELNKDITDYTFPIEVVKQNKTVPVILTDNKNNYISSVNLGLNQDSIYQQIKKLYPDKTETYYRFETKRILNDTTLKLIEKWQTNFPPIPITYKGKIINIVYYRESKLIEELEQKKDSLSKIFKRELIKNEALVPVILTDTTKTQIIETNLDSLEYNAPGKLQLLLESMSNYQEPIKVQLNENETALIFYRDSEVLTQLKYFPYIQITIVGFFALIAYLLFSTFRKAEQNRVWVGMAKETAHQLGTPISSLMAWIEILKSQQADAATINEMNKDIQRLQTVTERFSKIGSEGNLSVENIDMVFANAIQYLKSRLSKNIEINLKLNEKPLLALINIPLFEWVIENIIKNAVDAMEGEGKINIEIKAYKKNIIIDISDTGKGIASKYFKTIFEPGYTTKKRGWGLGLPLAKRIIEYYHKGEIYVYKSETGKGTTFRIKLVKAN